MEQELVAELSFTIVLIQLADSYLRYLPFREHVSEEERRRLSIGLGIWGGVSFFAYLCSFLYFGIWAHTYKAVLMAGWIPWLLIFMATVRRDKLMHIFVQGMLSVWSFMLHSISGIFVALFFVDWSDKMLISIHGMLYPLLILVFMPIERRIFSNLLPPERFFAVRPYGYFITAMPFIVLFSHFLLMADGELLHSWNERLSRLVLPVSFFFLYRYVLLSGKEFYEYRKGSRNAKRIEEQVSFLEKRYRLSIRNQKRLSIIRHDLRHNYRILYGLLKAGDLSAARAHIKTQMLLLDSIKELPFSKSPLLNAALSVHLWKAERLGIRIRQKINLPEGRFAAEGDVALLLAELLENAVESMASDSEEGRELSLVLVSDGRRWILSLENHCSKPVSLGTNGLPVKDDGTMGIGMQTLSRFLAQHGGEAKFSYEEGIAKYEISWIDEAEFQVTDSYEDNGEATLTEYEKAQAKNDAVKGESPC